ncbi:diacylglycerol kinase family protein [Patescibacteria group bacterium]
MPNQLRTLRKSITYACKGLAYTFKNEQNFRIQLVIAFVVVFFMILFRVEQWEAVALVFVIAAVLITELLNTILERLVDILKPRLSHYSEIVKDMMAAAVVIASLGAIIVGSIIFYPYFYSLIFKGVL